jgi:hypothetical protein
VIWGFFANYGGSTSALAMYGPEARPSNADARKRSDEFIEPTGELIRAANRADRSIFYSRIFLLLSTGKYNLYEQHSF